MEKFTYKKLYSALKSKGLIAGLSGLLLVSCVPMGGYTETDGVYYDPNRDTLPQGAMNNNGNRVGDYYDYQYADYNNQYLNSDNRTENWNDGATNSDWGSFAGTDTYYTNNSWGSPWGMYGGFGMGWGMGMGFGWGSPWGFGGMYSPWGWGYNNWYNPYFGFSNFYGYNGFMNPHFGYNPYGYYGMGAGFNSYGGGFINKRSGSDGSMRNSLRNSNINRSGNYNNSGFRNGNTRMNSNQNNPRYNNSGNYNNGGFRTGNQNNNPRQYNTPRQTTPSYQQQNIRTNPSNNMNNSGGFRSGGSGGFGGSSSSGTRSSGGGGFRR